MIEVHAEEALVRPDSNQRTQVLATILSPKVQQITARHGGLDFIYRQEFRNLPEGQTYRIYLDSPGEPQAKCLFHLWSWSWRRCGIRRAVSSGTIPLAREAIEAEAGYRTWLVRNANLRGDKISCSCGHGAQDCCART
jgi:hypothetical protein